VTGEPLHPEVARGLEPRLLRQLGFLAELDALKGVLRQTLVLGGERRENSAEHSWHLAMMAMVLEEHAPAGADPCRVARMALVHDVVEIHAGDAFAYDAAANAGRPARERDAADRLFGALPGEQGAELRALWEEFEAGDTADARYANALDRLQPLLQNHRTGGGTWLRHGVAAGEVLRRMEPIRRWTPGLWPLVERVVEAALSAGHLRAGEG
jgi:putative hydrolases of HD superfamily